MLDQDSKVGNTVMLSSELQHLVSLLNTTECSLVVQSSNGAITTYNKKGVRDLIWLLDNEAWRLKGAVVADKVIGKAAAGLMVQGGVLAVYAKVMSRKALPLLNEAGIECYSGQIVDKIVIPEGDNRCPLEQIVDSASSAVEVECLLREHFAEMQRKHKGIQEMIDIKVSL